MYFTSKYWHFSIWVACVSVSVLLLSICNATYLWCKLSHYLLCVWFHPLSHCTKVHIRRACRCHKRNRWAQKTVLKTLHVFNKLNHHFPPARPLMPMLLKRLCAENRVVRNQAMQKWHILPKYCPQINAPSQKSHSCCVNILTACSWIFLWIYWQKTTVSH